MGIQGQRIIAEGRGSIKCNISHCPLGVFLSLHERFNGDGKSVRMGGSADNNTYGSTERVNRAFHKLGKGCSVRAPPLQDFGASSVSGGDNAQAVAGPLNGIAHTDQKVLSLSPDIFVTGDSNFSACAIAGIDKPLSVIGNRGMRWRVTGCSR